jgi:hypothetical protein
MEKIRIRDKHPGSRSFQLGRPVTYLIPLFFLYFMIFKTADGCFKSVWLDLTKCIYHVHTVPVPVLFKFFYSTFKGKDGTYTASKWVGNPDVLLTSVADPHHVDADPDPFHFYPDPTVTRYGYGSGSSFRL